MLPNTNLATFNPALEVELLRSICRKNFYRFVQEFWDIVVPEKPVWNWHIEYLCWELQKLFENVEAGKPKEHDLIINLAPGSSKCVVAGSIVTVGYREFKKIEDITVGDTVLSVNPKTISCPLPDESDDDNWWAVNNDSIFEQKVVDVGSFEAECVEVKTLDSVPIICSTNHPFLTLRGWVNAEDLTDSDCVLMMFGAFKEYRAWWSGIDYVKKVGRKTVYHLGVEAEDYDLQNYFVNNVCNHNSSLFSIMFPAWAWCRMPSCRFITASFNNDLSEGFARKSKLIFKSDRYRKCFHTFKFFPDRAGFYRNQFGGERMAFTTGTSPTGQHAHFVLTDDPIDPINQDRAPAIANINTWMHRVIRTRAVDAAVTPFVLVMQRLSVDDPTGEWLERSSHGGTPVKHICLPASIESGQVVKPPGLKKFYKNNLFDPIRLPYRVLQDRKNELGNFDYKAQFDQNPLPREGLMFKVQKMHIKNIEEFDPIRTKVRYWDKAISTNINACFTVGVLMGKTAAGKFFIMDVRRGQWDAATREQIILDTAKADGYDVVVGIEQEPGPIWEEEMVLMRDGSQIPLKEVRKGDWVINQFGDATRVLEVHIQGDRLCRKIVSGYHGHVWAALDHPFITPNGDIPAGELKLCDPVYIMEDWEKVEDMVAACNQERTLPCRCLTVEKGESFVVNVFVVHNSGGVESALYTVKNLAGFKVCVDKASISKEARAEPLAIQVDYDNVSLLPGNWNSQLISEFSTFPRGQYKDIVDATVGAFRLLVGAVKRKAGPLFDHNSVRRY